MFVFIILRVLFFFFLCVEGNLSEYMRSFLLLLVFTLSLSLTLVFSQITAAFIRRLWHSIQKKKIPFSFSHLTLWVFYLDLFPLSSFSSWHVHIKYTEKWQIAIVEKRFCCRLINLIRETSYIGIVPSGHILIVISVLFHSFNLSENYQKTPLDEYNEMRWDNQPLSRLSFSLTLSLSHIFFVPPFSSYPSV
jgi:hypothetical protein